MRKAITLYHIATRRERLEQGDLLFILRASQFENKDFKKVMADFT